MIYEELNKLSHVQNLDGEIWKPITGYEEHYMISNYGRVKRLAFTRMMYNQVTSWEQFFPENIYMLNGNTQNYPQVALCVDNKERRVCRVHRLVAEHFLAPPSEKLVEECRVSGLDYVPVEHEDDDPRNPHVSNLRWCTPSFNNKKASYTRDYSYMNGSQQYMAILNESDVLEIIKLLDSKAMSQEKIGEMFGVKQITISNINTGRSWAHLTSRERTERSRKRKPKRLMERTEL